MHRAVDRMLFEPMVLCGMFAIPANYPIRWKAQAVKKPLQNVVATRLIALRAVRSLLAKRCGVKRWALPIPTKGFHPLES